MLTPPMIVAALLAIAVMASAPSASGEAPGFERTLPLAFSLNEGQTHADVRLHAHGRGYAVFATKTGFVLGLDGSQAGERGAVVQMRLGGATRAASIVGVDELPGKAHYLIGEPSRWRTNVRTYAKVVYRKVYPGIDLVLYGNGGHLAYDFVLAPGADPGRIAVELEGADRIEVDGAGDLIVHVPGGRLRQTRPVVYQEDAGGRRPVAAGYVLRGRAIGFQVGSHDRGKPLVIDPTLAYSTYFGSGISDGRAIALDGAGRIYITGATRSSTFPTRNPAQPGYGGGDAGGDAFVTKLTSDGSEIVYSTYLGGGGDDIAFGIAVDDGGRAYVTGRTNSSNFPTTDGAFQPTAPGNHSAFVTKLSPSGSSFAYSTFLGGVNEDEGRAIAVDAAGSAHVTGQTGSPDFPTANAYQPTFVGGFDRSGTRRGDAFVAKLNPAGSALVYGTFLGGSWFDTGTGIAVDTSGNAAVTGWTYSHDFPVRNALQPVVGGGPMSCAGQTCAATDPFVAKFAPDGEALWATYFGGPGNEFAFGIAVDRDGHPYVLGRTGSTVATTAFREFGAIVAKFDASGTALHWATLIGCGDAAIAVDGTGSAYVTGTAYASGTSSGNASSECPLKRPLQPEVRGPSDVYVARLNPAGTKLEYATYLGGASYDDGSGIAVDGAGNAYVTGWTWSRNFPTVDPIQEDQPSRDIFIAKISPATPDLIETAVSNPPATGVAGDSFTVTDTVRNRASGGAGPSTTTYYLSVDHAKTGGDRRLAGVRRVPALDAGETSAGSVTVTISSATATGTYFLLACADDRRVIGETNERNNCLASATAVQVEGRADLVETAVSDPPANATPDSTFSVTDTVRNRGTVTAAASKTRYYLSADGVRNSGDRRLRGARAVPELSAGTTSTGTVIVTVPSMIAAGTYLLLACADDLRVVTEATETNNCRAAAAPVIVNP